MTAVPAKKIAPAPARTSVNGSVGRAVLQGRILATAADLLIRHGYKAVSFLTIARELGITHSHVHYYFKTKALLAETVLQSYVDDMTEDFRAIWTAEESDLHDRLVQSRDWIWRQYAKFNPGGVGGNNWGLLARFTSEADLLTPAMRKCLATTLIAMDGFIETGIELAIQRGELSADLPRHALVLQISSVIHTSRHITRIENNFDRLDELLRWTLDVIEIAYGARMARRPWPDLPREAATASTPSRV